MLLKGSHWQGTQYVNMTRIYKRGKKRAYVDYTKTANKTWNNKGVLENDFITMEAASLDF